MKTYPSLADINYRPRSKSEIDCCGACEYLNTSGNALTCNRVTSGKRVLPQGICDLFKPMKGLDNAR
jgi:hypothetical protein